MTRSVVPSPDVVNSHYQISNSTPKRKESDTLFYYNQEGESVERFTEREKSYLDLALGRIRKNGIKGTFDEFFSQVRSYLEGGYHYKMVPSDTIPAACENLLLDLGIYDIPWTI